MNDAKNDTAGLWRCLLSDAEPAGRALDLSIDTIGRAFIVVPAALMASAIGQSSVLPVNEKAPMDANYGRYLLSRQFEALRWLGEMAVPYVALKGFAAALEDWPDPAQRVVGDLDLLVRRQDLARVVEDFAGRGFRFGGELKPRWGFLSDASFLPFYSTDRVCNIDWHIEPDSYPLHLGLDAAAVFAAAHIVEGNGLQIAVPCAEHALLIAVSNLAKDKFAIGGARKLIDIARLLRRPGALDWREIESRARRARLTIALRTALSLAVALGMPAQSVPEAWRQAPRGLRQAAWRSVLASWQSFDTAPVGLLRLLQREWLLAASPAVAVRLAGRRLRGLLAPRSGLPSAAVR